MKVLGLTKVPMPHYPIHGSDAYIVTITHDELAAAFERGYSNKLEPLKVGDEVSLASIPDQRARINAAMEAMQKGYEAFVKAAPVMADLARVIGDAKATGAQS